MLNNEAKRNIINIGCIVHVGSSINHLICTEVTRNVGANELKKKYLNFFEIQNFRTLFPTVQVYWDIKLCQ